MAHRAPRRVGSIAALLGLVGLLACGASDHASPEDVGSNTAAVTGGPTTYPINVTLPTGTSIVNTTVGAAGGIAYGPGDTIVGATASALGIVELGVASTSLGITASGTAKIDLGSVVNGNVTTGGLIVNLGRITGTQKTLSSTTATPLTTSWSVTDPGPDQGPITLTNNAVASPTPGSYDAVTVNPGSSLYLHGGTYFFQSLDLELGANLFIDNSHGPVFLYVTSALTFRGTEEALNAGTPEFFLGFLGTCNVTLEAPFRGVFLAPNSLVLHLADPLWVTNPAKKAAGNDATFYAISLTIDPGEKSIHRPSTGAPCRASRFPWAAGPRWEDRTAPEVRARGAREAAVGRGPWRPRPAPFPPRPSTSTTRTAIRRRRPVPSPPPRWRPRPRQGSRCRFICPTTSTLAASSATGPSRSPIRAAPDRP